MNTIRCSQRVTHPACSPMVGARHGGDRAGRRLLGGLLLALSAATLLLTGCSGSTPGTSGSSLSSQGQFASGIGTVAVTGRTTRGSSTLSQNTATTNGLTVTVESAAVSKDGTSYQTLVSGPVSTTLGLDTNPLLGTNDKLPTGDYKRIRVTLSDMSWSVDWDTTNPSPCTGATSGHAEGDQQLGTQLALYFATPASGGNTQAYYRANPPLSPGSYIGDADHPLIMPAPITVLKDTTTTVNLVFDIDHILSCNRVELFSATDTGDTAPQHSIVGTSTKLFGSYGLFEDSRRGLVGVTNSNEDSISIFGTGDSGNTAPVRTISGPDTLLNGPREVAFYRGASTSGDDDEILVANGDNDSVTIYKSTATGNAAPKRTITGFNKTLLNKPSGLAVYSPAPSDPTQDEVWVTNMGSGNGTVTVYSRENSGDAVPIYPLSQPTTPVPSIGGSATGLNQPCGIDVADSNNHTYVFVTNAGADSITIYDRADVAGQTQTTGGNVAPAYTIQGTDTGLSGPCAIHVDSADGEIFVANTGAYASGFQKSSITVYDLSAVLQSGGGTVDAQPVRTLSAGAAPAGGNSGLTAPTAILVQGGSLWVADRGRQPALARLPDVYPSSSNGEPAQASLSGKYNVVLLGVDLSKGINDHGYKIPTIFAERGVANFDASTSPWPAFNLRIDTENRRTIINPGCTQVDIGGLPKQGFYGVGNDDSFYAFNQGDHGNLRGAFRPDGEAFTASFYNSPDKLFVMYGIKDTALATAYLGTDGSQTGGSAPYSYTSYSTLISQVGRFQSPPTSDLLHYQLFIGAAGASHNQFDAVSADSNTVSSQNTMGDLSPANSSTPAYRTGSEDLRPSAYAAHAGGELEAADYGLAGAVANGGGTLLFMDDTRQLDADLCPKQAGIGMGLRQAGSKTFSNSDLKGVYFVAGFGDQYQGKTDGPDPYMTEAGTLTFDGTSGVQMDFDMNADGEIASDQGTLTYQVTTRTLPLAQQPATQATINIVDLYGSDKSIPFASAIISEDGKTLTFFRNLVQPNTGPPPDADPVRFLGLAVYQHS